MRFLSRWLQQPISASLALASLLLLIPMLSRYFFGWSQPFGYLSDLTIGSALLILLARRSLWLSVPIALFWSVLTLSSAELVSAVGRMPEVGDLHYLTDAQFVSRSTEGNGLNHPVLAGVLLLNLLVFALLQFRQREADAQPVRLRWLLLPLTLFISHNLLQARIPSDAAQWAQFNLPHKLLVAGINSASAQLDSMLNGDQPPVAVDISALSRLDLNGAPLLSGPGKARNVLIVTLEGIPGAYIEPSRHALRSRYHEDLMPRLSAWAHRGMLTSDYVLHSHQTIRGLYAMLCGDYAKLDSGTPKGVELLGQAQRSEHCLPAQLRANGFSTHYLQGAGLRFMAKDQIMPRMGFEKTLGRDWFKNDAYLEFPWGMDDKAYFEGALSYIEQLRQAPDKPWMLTLLTVGTHQPYSAPADYLQRYSTPKQAAVAYLDDAISDFLDGLKARGVLKDTLVIVTSDESHGIENVRLASAWGFNLILAPEQEQLPALKTGTYGHVDLTVSILDYLGLAPPQDLIGRSMLRDYSTGRSIISYTNGLLREHDGTVLTECDFQNVCRRYASTRFISDRAEYLGRFTGVQAQALSQRAALLDQSLQHNQSSLSYQFANNRPIKLSVEPGNDWADNLVGAQYLLLPKGSHTQVTLRIRAVGLDATGAHLQLKAKEYERDVSLPIPELPILTADQPLEVEFAFDNLDARKAFSFHLLGQGNGAIEITDFSVDTVPLNAKLLAAQQEDGAPEIEPEALLDDPKPGNP
ncbi:sulfatase [Pseudomonas sp. J237]|nr:MULTISPECIES: LTA synthase family protein [Pseudomonas]OEO23901.1 sulfatase [Pseudomonas sp. J237]